MYALLITMLKLVVPMAVGFLLYKCRLITNQSNQGMSYLVVLVASPCAMFKSITTMSADEMGNAFSLLWIGAVLYAALIVLAWVIVKLLRVDPKISGVYQAALIFGNVGFLGLPLAESLFGDVGLFYMAFLNIHFTLLAYSYGLYLITRSGSGKSGFSLKKLVNPGLIGIIVAAIFYFFQIPVPDVVMEPISFISNINSPLAMVVLGSTAAAYSLKNIFRRKKIYILAAIKLILFPLAAYLILRLLIPNELMVKVLTIYVGTPTAAVVGILALTNGTGAEEATSATIMMNILCIVSIPILYIFMMS